VIAFSTSSSELQNFTAGEQEKQRQQDNEYAVAAHDSGGRRLLD
jgi:hypothetical protein